MRRTPKQRSALRYGVRVTEPPPEPHARPSDIAALLGVSGATVRRIALDYEEIFEPLPRDDQQRGRLWPMQAVAILRAAHAAVREGRAESTRAALEAIKEGRELPARLDVPAPVDVGAALESLERRIDQQAEGTGELLRGMAERDTVLAEALRALASEIQAQSEDIKQLRAQIEQTAARPAPAPERRGLIALLLSLFR